MNDSSDCRWEIWKSLFLKWEIVKSFSFGSRKYDLCCDDVALNRILNRDFGPNLIDMSHWKYGVFSHSYSTTLSFKLSHLPLFRLFFSLRRFIYLVNCVVVSLETVLIKSQSKITLNVAYLSRLVRVNITRNTFSCELPIDFVYIIGGGVRKRVRHMTHNRQYFLLSLNK